MSLLYGILSFLGVQNDLYITGGTFQKTVNLTNIWGEPIRGKERYPKILPAKRKQNVTKEIGNLSVTTVKQTTQRPQVPRVYLCVNDLGRLGNKLFEVATMVGTARRFSITPAIPEEGGLHKVFNIPYTRIKNTIYSHFKGVGEAKACTYTAIKENITSNTTMHGYFQSWRYFANVFPELKKSLTFVDDIRSKATDVLIKTIRDQHGNVSLVNRTFVGIHIRRGDLINSKDKVSYGYKVGSEKYLLKAMSYFTEKFGSVMFVVCSNGMEWSQKVIPRENATFSLNQSADVDLAMLSQCNHTIMTVGSYGWWAGWMAGGITIYQKQQVREGTALANLFTLTDYMLPEWIGLEETG